MRVCLATEVLGQIKILLRVVYIITLTVVTSACRTPIMSALQHLLYKVSNQESWSSKRFLCHPSNMGKSNLWRLAKCRIMAKIHHTIKWPKVEDKVVKIRMKSARSTLWSKAPLSTSQHTVHKMLDNVIRGSVWQATSRRTSQMAANKLSQPRFSKSKIRRIEIRILNVSINSSLQSSLREATHSYQSILLRAYPIVASQISRNCWCSTTRLLPCRVLLNKLSVRLELHSTIKRKQRLKATLGKSMSKWWIQRLKVRLFVALVVALMVQVKIYLQSKSSFRRFPSKTQRRSSTG